MFSHSNSHAEKIIQRVNLAVKITLLYEGIEAGDIMKLVFLTKSGLFIGYDDSTTKGGNDEIALQYARHIGEPVGWTTMKQVLPSWKVGEMTFVRSIVQQAIFPKEK
ncbi:hypothetical protein SUNDANCE_187 [Brevibacillus phage Sundance]|uniref:hypothetical protein n=1 Tax=Brevibacillus phage Sundance TaxID=1691958 RepID=UPI0006BE0D25|nr:hypothetical protein AVT09_gp187 [Brevibacillus phage Sundance]ALA48003.1 hypothetical protein SUNDANCE_187 [Brevibacillus phage Sundance]